MSDPIQTIGRQSGWKDGSDSAGKTMIDGAVRGDVQAKIVTVGATGRLTGNIYAAEVEICGTVTGGICAKKIALRPGARVQGVLIARELDIALEAHFDGKCRSLDRLMAEVTQAKRPHRALAAE